MRQAIILPVSEVIVPPDRQRRTFDEVHLLELAKSIETKCLIHAIVLREDGKTLIAGESRLRAITQHLVPFGKTFSYNGETVPAGHIVAIVAQGDDPLLLEEIEFEENVRRKNLTWQEEAAAMARFHDLKQKQAAQKATILLDKVENGELPAETTKVPAHTIADTAKIVHGRSDGDYQNVVRAQVAIAKHLNNPEVARAKNAKEALKILQRQERDKVAEQMALTIGKTFSAADHTILQGSCLDILQQPEMQGRFDVILTDPPYGMGAHTFGDGGGRLSNQGHNYDDSYEAWQILMKAWAPLSWAVTKAEAHAYVFCDVERFYELKAIMESAGWYVFRTPLVNYKVNSGRVPLPEHGPRRQYETFLYAMKGKKKVNFIGSDVFESGSDEQMDFGAQKPVSLFVDILKRSIIAGDEVLDAFAGTGPIIPACHALKCKATAIEREPEQAGKIIQRAKDLG